MAKQWETILYEKIDPEVAKITLNRPEVRNAQSWALLRELDEAFREAEDDEAVKVIVLAGSGVHFSAGHDLGSPQSRAERAAEDNSPKPGVEKRFKREMDIYVGYCMRWRDIPKPTIAMVQGGAIAAGAMVAASMDLIIASEDAFFSDPVVRMGIGGVEYWYHPWDYGIRKAKELLFTGEPVSAQEAWRLGLVNHVVPRDKLEEETLKMAKKIALMPAFALYLAKLQMNETLDIMGFRTAQMNIIKAHHLAHDYNAEVAGGGLINPVGNLSVGEWAKKRDAAFREEKGKEEK